MGFGKDGRGVIIKESNQVSVGGLAADTGILLPAIAVTEDFRMLKAEVIAHVEGLTSTEGSGLILGLADGELSLAEIEEAIELNGPLDRNDRKAMEFATRPVWLVAGSMPGPAGTTMVFVNDHGGRVVVWKKRWTFSNPEGWQWFVYNKSDIAVTTGAAVQLNGTYYGVWLS